VTGITLQPHGKTPEIARGDRDVGGAIAFGLFIVVVAVVLFTLRRLRSRVVVDQADRELCEAIDRFEAKLLEGVGGLEEK
jgi:hypothetical protein